MKMITILSFAIALSTVAIPAIAWDGALSGYISHIDVSGSDSHDFRVRLQGLPNICGTANWGYLDEHDDNYQAYVSVLLSAFTTDRKVVIYSNLDTSGYCKIGYVIMENY